MYKKIAFIISFFYVNSGMALNCRSGQYFVSAHHRDSYYRKDGTFVSSANVEAHCRDYNFSSPLNIKFENRMPEGWPYQLDLFKSWTEGEKKEVVAKVLQNGYKIGDRIVRPAKVTVKSS
jgi:hypothetical protein